MEKLKWGFEQRLRDSSWDCPNLSFDKDRNYGFSWPQRNYRCSFCKREFKSAQALGGHMNVHRRDRARMRLSPSWDSPNCPNPNSNPNPSFTSSSSVPASKFSVAFPSSLSSTTAVPNSALSFAALQRQEKPRPVDRRQIQIIDSRKKNKGAVLELTSSSFTRRKDARVWKVNEFVRLDLNLGLIQDAKDDLDLELRLGYS